MLFGEYLDIRHVSRKINHRKRTLRPLRRRSGNLLRSECNGLRDRRFRPGIARSARRSNGVRNSSNIDAGDFVTPDSESGFLHRRLEGDLPHVILLHRSVCWHKECDCTLAKCLGTQCLDLCEKPRCQSLGFRDIGGGSGKNNSAAHGYTIKCVTKNTQFKFYRHKGFLHQPVSYSPAANITLLNRFLRDGAPHRSDHSSFLRTSSH